MRYDALVVLGAQIKMDNTPSETLKRRLMLAFALYREHPVPIVCCGARGGNEPVEEGTFMCAYLRKQGVPEVHLYPENHSFDTVDNLRNAREVLDALGLSCPMIVTSDYHTTRTRAICKREKFPIAGCRGAKSDAKYFVKNYGREILAWGKFLLKLKK